MVSTNVDSSIVKGPYQDVKKDKPSSTQRPQPRAQMGNEKNGAWGSTYKNKQHFIDMHVC